MNKSSGNADSVSSPISRPTSVLIATPVYGDITVPTHTSMLMLQQAMWGMGLDYEFRLETGCAYVSMARNNLERQFMESGMDELLFIDADVGFKPEAVQAIMSCYWADVVAGVYPKKTDNPDQWPILLKVDDKGHLNIKDGLIEATRMPTGFMKIKRSVFEKMREAFPELMYRDPLSGQNTWGLFEHFIRNGEYFGDDYAFSQRWLDIGGSLWVMPDIDFVHRGGKNYQGNLFKYIMSYQSMPPAVIRAKGIEGWMTDKELQWLHTQASQMESAVEVGCWKGRSTLVFLDACKGWVTAVDHWKGSEEGDELLVKAAKDQDVFGQFMANVGNAPNLRVLTMESWEAATVVEGKVDMVFIDATHNYEDCLADIKTWLPKTKKLICGHDYSEVWPGVVRAVNETFGVETGGFNVCDTIWYKWLD